MVIKSGYFVLGGVEVLVGYSYKPAIAGVFHRKPQDCYEDEPEEIEIYSVRYMELELFKDELLSERAISLIEQHISDYEVDEINYASLDKGDY